MLVPSSFTLTLQGVSIERVKWRLPTPNYLLLPGHDSGLGRSRLAKPCGLPILLDFHDRCRNSRDSDIRVPTNHHAERDCSSRGHHHTPESRCDDAIIRQQSQSLGSTKTEEFPRARVGEIGMLSQTKPPSQAKLDNATAPHNSLFPVSLHSSPVHHPPPLRST